MQLEIYVEEADQKVSHSISRLARKCMLLLGKCVCPKVSLAGITIDSTAAVGAFQVVFDGSAQRY